jgi:hypothetical protein
VIIIVIIIILITLFYKFFGWTAFSYKTGDNPVWSTNSGKNAGQIRFKNCIFTIATSDGKIVTRNVTSVLNGMAVAYKGKINSGINYLKLTRPINAFSFVIPGYNDVKSGTDPSYPIWKTAKSSLTGYWRVI